MNNATRGNSAFLYNGSHPHQEIHSRVIAEVEPRWRAATAFGAGRVRMQAPVR